MEAAHGGNDTNDAVDEQLQSLTGAEHFLLGLTPLYWSHVPLCIADVHQLGLVNGVDCILSGAEKLIPIHKCRLVGMVVHVDVKAASVHYVLDDGTGLLDCVLWGEYDYYKLPNLVEDDDNDEKEQQRFKIGDMVDIMGRIKVVCMQDVREKRRAANGQEWEIFNCIREVKVISMNHVASSGNNNDSNPRFFCTDHETRHMKRVVDWNDEQQDAMNGVDMLRHHLGPTVAQQALSRQDFPAADDDVGAWRVFGTSCQCHDLIYKDELLYCHCQATSEALDPFLTVRDAILAMLLQAQEAQASSSKEPLTFSYQSIVTDTRLLAVVAKSQDEATTTTRIPASRIFSKTFGALRKDGILYLVNSENDTYMLLSKSRVLEPHTAKQYSKNNNKSLTDTKLLQQERRSILRDVPKSRLQHVKRCLEKARNEHDAKKPN